MTSLYDLLGCSPDATEEQLRLAYRRAARRVHPDVNPGADAETAIRRLNEAWAVLGDPDQRRRYDSEMGVGPGAPGPTRPPGTSGGPGPARATTPTPDPVASWMPDHRRSRLWRPSFVVVSILAVIFVVTAYAGANDHPKPSMTTNQTPPSTAALSQGSPVAPQSSLGGDDSASSGGASLVGKCILRLMGYDAIVLCSQHGAQMVVAEVTTASDCPPGSTVYQLEGHTQLVCLTPDGY